MDRVNEQMYQANIELVDRNKLLEEDKRMLQKRINKAIEYIEGACYLEETKYPNCLGHKQTMKVLDILKGRYVDNE